MSSVQKIFRKSQIAFKFILNILSRPKFLNSILSRFENGELDEFAISSWAQAGEDLALERVFYGKNNGFYIDIGAHHPERFSITKCLNLRGWSGINVDGNLELIQEFEERRPADMNISAVVGSKSSYQMYEFEERALSTIDKERMESLVSIGRKLKKVETLKGMTLKDVFDRVPENTKVNLLNLDIEGSELDALRSGEFEKMDYKRLPDWILIETKPPLKSALEEPSVKYLIELGYSPYLVLAMNTLLEKPAFDVFKEQIQL